MSKSRLQPIHDEQFEQAVPPGALAKMSPEERAVIEKWKAAVGRSALWRRPSLVGAPRYE